MRPSESAASTILTPPCRLRTREVAIGLVAIGGRQPIRIQSMTTTRTGDTEATVRQTIALVDAGCEIVRVTAPTVRDAEALGRIRTELRQRGIRVPLVADIHFLPAAAMEAALHVDKVRINPGNFADRKLFRRLEYSDAEYATELERVAQSFRPLVKRLGDRGVALRIGANHGSLSDRIMNRYGDTPLGMVESALEFIRVCRELDYHEIVVSMKASSPKVTIQAYRLLVDRMAAESMDYPIHLGVTEAGAGEDGRIKSALGIGALLEEGIGDTVRVSLTEDPVREVPAARTLVEMCGRPCAPEPGDAVVERIRVPWSRYEYRRRPSRGVAIGPIAVGGDAPPAVEVVLSPSVDPDVAQAAGVVRRLAEDPEAPVELVVLQIGAPDDLPWAEQLRAEVGGAGVGFILSLPARHLRSAAIAGTVLEARIETPADAAQAGRDLAGLWVAVTGESVTAVRERAVEIIQRHPRIAGLAVASAPDVLSTAARAVAAILDEAGAGDLPLRLAVRFGSPGMRGAMNAAACLGGLLCDGLGDAVRCDGPDSAADRVGVCYRILQAAGARITRAEFVSCPSCGRTLFDLETTTARIRDLTGHLTGVRIAVMGCMVNGPGEMADAHFGYVGAAPGRINLYVGRECVERNIPEAEAPDRLVALIRARGLWRDPPAGD